MHDVCREDVVLCGVVNSSGSENGADKYSKRNQETGFDYLKCLFLPSLRLPSTERQQDGALALAAGNVERKAVTPGHVSFLIDYAM